MSAVGDAATNLGAAGALSAAVPEREVVFFSAGFFAAVWGFSALGPVALDRVGFSVAVVLDAVFFGAGRVAGVRSVFLAEAMGFLSSVFSTSFCVRGTISGVLLYGSTPHMAGTHHA
jgi:hypothetical protein